jgi:hypothetical protein
VQRTTVPARPDFLVGRGCLLAREILGDGDDAVELIAIPLEAVEIHGGQLRGTDAPRADEGCERGDRREREIFERRGHLNARRTRRDQLCMARRVARRTLARKVRPKSDGRLRIERDGELPELFVAVEISAGAAGRQLLLGVGEGQAVDLFCTLQYVFAKLRRGAAATLRAACRRQRHRRGDRGRHGADEPAPSHLQSCLFHEFLFVASRAFIATPIVNAGPFLAQSR